MTTPFDPYVPRKHMTDQDRARVFSRENGCCSYCNRKLRPGDKWRVEHHRALENGGDNSDENLKVSCSWCWPAKDRADHGEAAKSRNTYTRHVVPQSERDERRGFKGWRKMDGTPVWRRDR